MLGGFVGACVFGHLFERQFALLERLALALVVGGVALGEHLFVGRVLQQVGRDEQRPGHHVHRGDVGDEEVFGVGRVAARLGVEVRAAALETAAAHDDHHGLHHFIEVDGELVGVPAVLVVTAVGVDGAQHARVDGALQFVLEGVARQRRVVDLDVDLEILVQAMGAQEADDRLGVDVVLVLHGFHGLGFDQEVALEAFRAGIVAGHRQHPGHVFLFALHVGVEQRHVALAAAPEDVVLAAQLNGRVDGVLDLQHRAGRRVEVGVGRSAVHVAGVREDVGRAPQQFDARLGLLLLGVGYDFAQIGLVLCGVGVFVHQVHVMEAVVFDAHLLHELESGVHLRLGAFDGAGRLVPGERLRAAAELVGALGAEGVPPRHREAQPVLHLAPLDHAFGFIVAECHRVLRGRALESDFAHGGEILFCHSRKSFCVVIAYLSLIVNS